MLPLFKSKKYVFVFYKLKIIHFNLECKIYLIFAAWNYKCLHHENHSTIDCSAVKFFVCNLLKFTPPPKKKICIVSYNWNYWVNDYLATYRTTSFPESRREEGMVAALEKIGFPTIRPAVCSSVFLLRHLYIIFLNWDIIDIIFIYKTSDLALYVYWNYHQNKLNIF